jgi:hypothetical protein
LSNWRAKYTVTSSLAAITQYFSSDLYGIWQESYGFPAPALRDFKALRIGAPRKSFLKLENLRHISSTILSRSFLISSFYAFN